MTNLECCICNEVYEELSKLVCGHSFCVDCIQKCSNLNAKCPLCRAYLNSEGYSDEFSHFLKDKPCLYQAFQDCKQILLLNLRTKFVVEIKLKKCSCRCIHGIWLYTDDDLYNLNKDLFQSRSPNLVSRHEIPSILQQVKDYLVE